MQVKISIKNKSLKKYKVVDKLSKLHFMLYTGHQVFKWDGKSNKKSKQQRGWDKILKKEPCVYCVVLGTDYVGNKVAGITIEHIKPRSMGGRDDWRNKSVACSLHNMRKGSLSLLQFLIKERERNVSNQN